MVSELINANPIVYEKKERQARIAPSVLRCQYHFPCSQPLNETLLLGCPTPLARKTSVDMTLTVKKLSLLLMLRRSDVAYGTLSIPKINQGHAASSSDLRDIKDPEHPYSLEELKVITEDAIEVDDKRSYVRVTFTPTVEHCSMATVIGLCLRVKLMRCLPSRYKVDIRVAPGTHATEAAVNKQLNDKERVAAALENPNLVDMVDECLAPSLE
ncbi:hypothetical protein HAX54_019491 [Datura stramonium]|nr:hypothetical protein [Datura stramonium]